MSDIENCSGQTEELEKNSTTTPSSKSATLPFSFFQEWTWILAGQYAELDEWDRLQPRLAEFSVGRSYWRNVLSDPPDVLLATDFPRTSHLSEGGAHVDFQLQVELVDQLHKLASGEHVTLSSLFLAAFITILHRYTGSNDVVVGCPISPSEIAETDPLIGLFSNAMPLRASFAFDTTFRQLLQRVHESRNDAHKFRDVPLQFILEDVARNRDFSKSPLFRVMFVHEFSESQAHGSACPILEQEHVDPIAKSVDLLLEVLESSTKVGGRLVYRSELWEKATILRMKGHFITLLEAIASDAERPLHSLPLLTEPERQTLLVEWNDTAVDFPSDKCVHELFQEQVERTPDAIALVFDDRQLTYRQLNERANQLAHYLQSLGVGPGTLVGICLERSPELVVSILGILKAGAVYVPLDVHFPEQRLNSMIRDAGISLLITRRPFLDRLPLVGSQVVCLDTDASQIENFASSNPIGTTRSNNLAYVMFTSGSTGQPKGVAIRHRSIGRLVFGNNYTKFGPDRVFVQLATPSFDAATFELWGALLHGSKLVLSPAGHIDFEQLETLLKKSGVTTLWLTAAMFNQILNERPEALTDVQEILTGGEALSVSHICRAKQTLGSRVQLINGYGPTECTTFTSCYRIPLGVTTDLESIPIGRPIANTQVYVLDPKRELVPIGVPGELYVGGIGLAMGYVNRPELTEEKFVTNPFNEDPDSRLYRTGDLVRWRADGNLEFLGRIDDQVKLRGFRIELGEIEAQLNACRLVDQSVVMLREDNPGEKQLVGYCVRAQGQVWSVTELLRHLRSRLPDYMVPSAFVEIESIPLTPSGKVNRRALPVPTASRPSLDNEFVAPRNQLEEKLTNICSQLLGVESIGVYDNFFDLGGHSLHAMQMISRVREIWGVSLPIRKLFDSPCIARLGLHIEELLSEEKVVTTQNFASPQLDGVLPTSFAQERIWFFDQFHPASSVYNIPIYVLLSGPLNFAALELSLREIVRRHKALRTVFSAKSGVLQSLLEDPTSFEMKQIDLKSLPEGERLMEARRQANEEAIRPFDLSQDLMLRARLWQLGDRQHYLVLTMHHIASDGWSVGVFVRELNALYQTYVSDQPSSMPELPIQYADYAVWQRESLEGAEIKRQLEYWREKLSGASAVLELPTDFPRPATQSFRGSSQSLLLSAQLTQEIDSMSRQEGVTPFMTLLAAFQVLLSRYSGQEDVSVGVPIAGRNRKEFESLVGFFVNTLVMRTDLSNNPTFREFLKDVREVALGAYSHQDVPFERLVEEIQPERNLSHSPLFQVMFVLQNAPECPFQLTELTTELEEPLATTAKFDLTLSVVSDGEFYKASLEYSTDLFKAATIARMLGHFESLLQAIVSDPSQQIGQLELLTKAEREQLLVQWNNTARPFPQDRCIHELFEKQVERNPDAVAVVFEDTHFTYSELNAEANKLAHYLRGLNVVPETLVGLCLEPSLSMIVGVLGIFKAGGVYVPFDPSYPVQRLEFMVEDSRPLVFITQQWLLSKLPQLSIPIVCLEASKQKLDEQSPQNIRSGATSENAAYVIYTSGSTGKPKGVVIRHVGLSNVAQQQAAVFGVGQNTRVLQFSSISFDASMFEIVMALVHGGTLYLGSREQLLPGPNLVQFLRDREISIATLTPSALSALPFEALPLLQTINVAGEACPLDLAVRWQPGRRFFNLYGPTESTIWSLCGEIRDSSESIHLGCPIANTLIHVLDTRLQLVPVGVPGELYIGGVQLAREYLRRPELTAERFIQNPFNKDGVSRLYRTGDRVRWRSDGTIEFMGRIDRQVKIRGHRIELGEIESVLNQHPRVAAAIAVAREDRAGDKRLVAYFVAQSELPPGLGELRRYLEERVPGYMVPSAFMPLDELPLSPNGKVDWEALPAPEIDRSELEQSCVGPRTLMEEMLTGVWSEILGLEQLGIHDNFFELGGHSLLAARVVARIQADFDLKVTVRMLFEAPTIAELAVAIQVQRHESVTNSPMMPIDRASGSFVPLSFAQQRFWFLEQLGSDCSVVHNAVNSYRLTGHLKIDALKQALDEFVARHEILRTTYHTVNGQPLQLIASLAQCPISIFDITDLPHADREAQAERLIAQESNRRIDLLNGPIFRGSLIRIREDVHMLVLVTHHIATDHWSMAVLCDEIGTLYNSYASGSPSPLSQLPVQYADYATWQLARNEGEMLKQQLDYWSDRLQDLTIAEIPPDFRRPTMRTFRCALETMVLPNELAEQTTKLSQRSGNTRFFTLLAALKVLLRRLTMEEDIVVGAHIAGRDRPETQSMMGCFLNTLVLRTDLSGNPTFRELLKRIRETALGAYANQEIPFEKLLQELRLDRELSRSPLFQVVLNDYSLDESPLELDGLETSPLPLTQVGANFEITLYARQRDNETILYLVYNADLFTHERMAELLRQYTQLLGQLVSHPDATIGSHSLLTDKSRAMLPDPLAALPSSHHEVVSSQFAVWAHRAPDQVAISHGAKQYSYRELLLASDKIAQLLCNRCEQPNERVVVKGKMSFGLVAGIIGVLSSGNVVVIIDEDLPIARQQIMIEQAACRTILVIGQSNSTTVHTAGDNIEQVIRVDARLGTIEPSHDTEPAAVKRIVNPDEPAYVFFTSGSTGEPKGVLGAHKGLSQFLDWQRTYFEIRPSDRVSQLSGLSFEPVMRDIFLPLTSGGTLCLPESRESSAVWQWLESELVTIVHSVPSLILYWLGGPAAPYANLSSLRYLFLGGEPLRRDLVNRWRMRFPGSGKLVNLYGTTETPQGRMYFEVPEKDLDDVYGDIYPIGRPIAGTQGLILNSVNNLCGIGELGEIAIRTPFHSLGYIKPTNSEYRFVQNPLSDIDGDVIFRTGDLGRYLPDGQIEIAGRVDDQLKIRGFRIEPAEIAATLNVHPDVDNCHVGAIESDFGDCQLVAWVATLNSRSTTAGELRKYLSKLLPATLIPSHFLFVSELPLTASGKIDRLALPAPTELGSQKAGQYVRPRNLLEEQMASIWSELLGVEQISIHDNFFSLGGHSLVAARVVARAASTLGVELPIRQLFESPTIAELATSVGALRTKSAPALVEPLIQIDRGKLQTFPLSHGQMRLWILEQMEGERTAYNIPYRWRLRGRLNREALRKALESIIERHESLRTTINVVDGVPVQVIQAVARFEFPLEDLRGNEGVELPSEALVGRCQREAERPFDLTHDLMLRAALMQLAEDDHLLLLTMHHIASDAWSSLVLCRELQFFYDSYSRNSLTKLPALPCQYLDYAVWQRKELEGERLVGLVQYWRAQLEGLVPLELPTDRPRPPRPSYCGGRYDFMLDAELVRKLRTLCKIEGVTLHMALLAAFQTLLSRYSGQEDFAIGTPIAGRNHEVLEDMIGFFANTLVIRADLSGNPTFRELLQRVLQISLAAYDHQGLPFEKLVEELRPARDVSRSPFIQVLFQLLDFPSQSLMLRDLEVSLLPSSSQRARFDLEVQLWQQANELEGTVVYSTDLFDHSTIERMLGHFATLLKAIVAAPDLPLHRLPLLIEPERHQLLVEWNATQAYCPREKCVHELFEEQVDRTPFSVAVVFEDGQLTYDELNTRANQLAHYLQNRGVGPETKVGLYLDRSLELVIGILGILKAGGAYLPLDAKFPPKRLEFMLQDASVNFLVTQRHLLKCFPSVSVISEPILLDPEVAVFDEPMTNNPKSGVGPDNLAYIMYTSGSTGRPKGVQIPHGAVVNFLTAMASEPGLTGQDRLLSITTPTFDISVLELLLPLTVGACVEVAKTELVTDPISLAQRLETSRATVMQATPSTWQMLIQSGWKGNQSLKVLCGGEALSDSLAAALLQRCGQLWNMYGPTETTIWSSKIRVLDCKTSGSIGRPIANTKMYVLDENFEPLPIGVVGELYIGGMGLARGYQNLPDHTAERFVPDPFSSDPAHRLYRTGDRCRWRQNGVIEFVGRIGDQIKLRGFRIELHEIEEVLKEHSSVAQCVALLREDEPGRKRIVAYCVPESGLQPSLTDLRIHLQDRLPEYMIPSAFVLLDAIPLSASGKLDRRKLLAPDNTISQLEGNFVVPRNSIEERLAALWCEHLGLKQVGVHDDFFAIGGHSLLAVGLFASIEKEFGKRIPLALLFEKRTIAQLSIHIADSTPAAREFATLITLQPQGNSRTLFMMPSIGGELIFAKKLIEELGNCSPVIGIQPAMKLENIESFRDFRVTARLFVDVMLKHQPHGPFALAGYSWGGIMAYEIACILTELGEKVDLLALIDVGPAQSGQRPKFGDRLRYLALVLRNLPFWIRDEALDFSALRLISSGIRNLRRICRHVASFGRVRIELDDVIDTSRIPSQNRELMKVLFAAFRDYKPQNYSGKLTLIRALVRPLLSGRPRDLGWRGLVNDIEVHQINGNHLTILHRPNVGALSRLLSKMLRALPTEKLGPEASEPKGLPPDKHL